MKIISNEPIIQSLKQLENLGFNASDIKNLYLMFSKISKIYGLDKKEIKIRFFRCINYYFNDLLPLQKDIGEKINKIFILDNEISSRRKIIEESQPIVFAILQHLVSSRFNEHYILKAFKIFKTDLCNKMPYDDRTYIERLSKDLNRYPTVRDTLDGLNTKILMKKSSIEKLSVDKSNLEAILLSLVIPIIYFYFTLLLIAEQIQIQNNLIKRIRLNFIFSYLLPLLLFSIVTKDSEKSVKSTFTIKQNNNKNNKKKLRKKKKVVKERKTIRNYLTRIKLFLDRILFKLLFACSRAKIYFGLFIDLNSVNKFYDFIM